MPVLTIMWHAKFRKNDIRQWIRLGFDLAWVSTFNSLQLLQHLACTLNRYMWLSIKCS